MKIRETTKHFDFNYDKTTLLTLVEYALSVGGVTFIIEFKV